MWEWVLRETHWGAQRSKAKRGPEHERDGEKPQHDWTSIVNRMLAQMQRDGDGTITKMQLPDGKATGARDLKSQMIVGNWGFKCFSGIGPGSSKTCVEDVICFNGIGAHVCLNKFGGMR